LATNISSIGANWTPLDVPLVGRNYRARRIHQLNENPFDLVAASLTNVRGDMPKHTLVLTAAQTGGFILLDGIASLAAGNPGSGEELQDHECELSKTLAHPG
jgi:CDP-diacylglycerol pyrophosphatase